MDFRTHADRVRETANHPTQSVAGREGPDGHPASRLQRAVPIPLQIPHRPGGRPSRNGSSAQCACLATLVLHEKHTNTL